MTLKLELRLSQNYSFDQVDGLNNNLVDLLVHAHLDQLIKCRLKTLFLSIHSRDVLDDLFEGSLSHLPLRTLEVFHEVFVENLD